MNAKKVLSKIVEFLSAEEVELTYAKLKDGTIVESKTFDVGQELFVVTEDGKRTPAPDGTHELMLKDTEGNETMLKVISKDGEIKERENVEMADEDAEMVKTEKLPSVGNEDEKNVMPDVPGQITSGTLKMEEETEEVDKDMPETDGKPMDDEDMKKEEMGKKMEEMAYRIEEMEKKMMKMEEAMTPPVDQMVNQEVAMEEEELPKLDGAPIEDKDSIMKFESNRKQYGKKLNDPQSTFLSKLYN